MSYTKMHTDEWLYGSIRKMKPETRAVWVDAQAQADLSVIRGTICAAPGVGYSLDQLAAMWNTPKTVIEEAFKAFVSEGYLSINHDLTITLIEWLRFQSEYQRVKKYKDTEKNTEKGTTKNTEKGTFDTVSISNSDSEFVLISDELISVWADFLEMRKTLKKPAPATVKAQRLIVAELEKLAPGDNAKKKLILEQSIMNGWRGVFPIKEGQNGTNKGYYAGRFVGEFEKGASEKYRK